jgi:LacI family transcriptional regulator
MATRSDVAKMAGVSEATVSFVMNDTKNVTPEVRRRVLTAVDELGYRSNLVARSLATGRTRHVVMLVDNLRNPHYCEMLEGAQQVASESGYIVSVLSVSVTNVDTIANLVSRGVDGVILTLLNDNAAAAWLRKRLPSVTSETADGQFLTVDYRPAILEMVGRLKELGHRRIAFISGLPLDESNARYGHLLDALARHGLKADESLFTNPAAGSIATTEQSGLDAMNSLLDSGADFTAVFAINDLMAIGAAKALRDRGLSIPGDVSLVGCDHLAILDWFNPALSTMELGSYRIGCTLMRQLIHIIDKKPSGKKLIEVRFLEKESVGPAPKQD